MSNEKKNPLIGAFRTPVAGAPPTSAPPIPAKETKPPILSPAAVKPGEVKKPAEPAKDDKAAKDGKPTAPPVTPAKPDEAKKSAEPAKDDKATKDSKPAVAPVAPAKADEVKKPIEPVKDDKAVKADKPADVPAASTKPDEVKKPDEPVKAAVPQKPPEQPKDAATATRTADGPKGSAVTKVFEDRLDAPAEADFFKLPIPNEGEIYSMAVHPAYLKDFLDHPFTVNRETQDYKDLFESIKNYGIREPVLCRPGRNGGLEIISGHRRHDIGAQLNYPIPVLIERVDEDDAQIQCVDGNLHRKDIPISELARAAQMKMDALKRKAGRRSKADILAGKAPMKRSDMSTAPITASAFLNTPAHSTQKFLAGHSARPSTVSMKMWYCPLFPKCSKLLPNMPSMTEPSLSVWCRKHSPASRRQRSGNSGYALPQQSREFPSWKSCSAKSTRTTF